MSPPPPPPPPPIPVRNHIPSGADIASESAYQEFGGGVNPLAYKGYDMYARTFGISPSPTVARLSRPVSHKASANRRPILPVYDFGDDEDDGAGTVPSVPIPHHPNLDPSHRQQPHSPHLDPHGDGPLCCPLLGPLSPFIARLTLTHVACSTLLPHPLYVGWRVVTLLTSLTVFVQTVAQSIRFVAGAQGAALVFSFVNHVLMLRRAFQYANLKKDYNALIERSSIFGWNAFVFQSALHLCLSIPVVYFVDAILGFGPELDMPNSYIGSLSSMLMLALTVVELMDMLITPVPFRATYVIPATLYGMVVSLVTMLSLRQGFSMVVILFVGLGGFAVGLVLHLIGRLVYLLIHRHRVIADNLIAPTPPPPYPN